MKYELIGKNNLLAPIETVLTNRGIEDIQSFLHTSEKDVIHWSKLRNINEAVDCLIEHIKKESKIFVQVDSDCDGNCSSAALINYLRSVFPKVNIQWRIHNGKEHGVVVKEVPSNVDVVIIPDAGSNQYDEHKELKEKGIDVIVLDHHECEKESEYAIVVNNQLSPEYENKTLVGTGIVYKFLKALDSKLEINKADNYLDLVAIGLIADMADTRNKETKYYINKGLSNVKNSFIQALIDKQSYSLKGEVTTVGVQFYIAPLINACVRTGNMQEKLQMMNAFLESKERIYYPRNKEYEDVQTSTARLLGNIKNRQGKLRDKGTVEIEKRIKEKNLLENKVLTVIVSGILDKNLTGLVANQVAKQYKRPVLLLREREEGVLSGSARGYDKGFIKDFKKYLKGTDKFVYCEGHGNAFGVEINAGNLIQVNDLINEDLKDIEIDIDIHYVDFIIPAKQLKERFIKDLSKYKHLWGQSIEEPLIAIKDIEVNKNDVYLNGKTSKSIKFIHNGIEFIKFFSNEEEWESIVSKGERLVLDVVGKCSINEYKGETKPQVVIDDYEVTKVKKKEYVF